MSKRDTALDEICEAVHRWTGASPSLPDDPGSLDEFIAPHLAAIRSEAWEEGMTAAKLQAAGIKPARNPYLKEA
jgi:hypothetical protein